MNSHEGTKARRSSFPLWSSCLCVFVAMSSVMGFGCAAHHTTTGLVLKVDRPGATVTISHDAFPGFMDAMAMPFELKGSARSVKVAAGDRVRLRLSVKRGPSGRGKERGGR